MMNQYDFRLQMDAKLKCLCLYTSAAFLMIACFSAVFAQETDKPLIHPSEPRCDANKRQLQRSGRLCKHGAMLYSRLIFSYLRK